MSFLSSLNDNLRLYPDKVALEFVDPPIQRVTYSELDQFVGHTADYLATLGVKPGDRVALQLPKCLEFILLHLATLRLGAISLPLNPAYPPDEVEYFLSDSGAKLFFALESAKHKVQAIIHNLPDVQDCLYLDPDQPQRFESLILNFKPSFSNPLVFSKEVPALSDTAVIVYTSGTTGRPKGAEITHGNLSANLDALHTAWEWQPKDVLLHALPIFHVHGLFVALHGALHAGATTLLMRQFDASKTLQTLVERQCSVFMAVPTIHRRLIEAAKADRFDLSKLRLITSGSDRLPEDVFTGFQKTFGTTLLERYGMTETGMNCSNPLYGERRIGSVGLPLPGVEVRVWNPETGVPLTEGQVGEVQLRGPNVFKGYWKQPEKTTEAFTADGWFRTGDLGYLEPDGYLTLCGRFKDLIISGGMNIYPPEVERVLNEHPAVGTSAVFGCPDREWGERVTAVVVLEPNVEVSMEALIDYCRQRLAPYKTPRTILVRESLPRNAMGKVSKAELRRECCTNIMSLDKGK